MLKTPWTGGFILHPSKWTHSGSLREAAFDLRAVRQRRIKQFHKVVRDSIERPVVLGLGLYVMVSTVLSRDVLELICTSSQEPTVK